MPDKVKVTYGDIGGKRGIKEFSFDTDLWSYKVEGNLIRVTRKVI